MSLLPQAHDALRTDVTDAYFAEAVGFDRCWRFADGRLAAESA